MSEEQAIYRVEQEIEEGFVISDDNKAEWAIVTIKEEQADRDRLISVCEQKMQEYKDKIDGYKMSYENKTSNLKSLLELYFRTVKRHKTKTQETYQLPSGKLKLKYPSPSFIKDDKKLIEWLKNNDKSNYIKTEETPKWGELKKSVIIDGDKVITEDGEIVEGVTAQEKPPVFEVEI